MIYPIDLVEPNRSALALSNFYVAFLKSLLKKTCLFKVLWSVGKCSLVGRESRWNGVTEIPPIDRLWGCVLHSYGSMQGLMACYCEQGNVIGIGYCSDW